MQIRKELILAALLSLTIAGCRVKGYESMTSSIAPNVKSPYKGDPYTFGGLQEGTGGLIAASRSSMETEDYSEPKYKKLAGPDAFVSMSGHSLAKAKPSDIVGDYQPLPSQDAHGKTAGSDGDASGH